MDALEANAYGSVVWEKRAGALLLSRCGVRHPQGHSRSINVYFTSINFMLKDDLVIWKDDLVMFHQSMCDQRAQYKVNIRLIAMGRTHQLVGHRPRIFTATSSQAKSDSNSCLYIYDSPLTVATLRTKFKVSAKRLTSPATSWRNKSSAWLLQCTYIDWGQNSQSGLDSERSILKCYYPHHGSTQQGVPLV